MTTEALAEPEVPGPPETTVIAEGLRPFAVCVPAGEEADAEDRPGLLDPSRVVWLGLSLEDEEAIAYRREDDDRASFWRFESAASAYHRHCVTGGLEWVWLTPEDDRLREHVARVFAAGVRRRPPTTGATAGGGEHRPS